MYNHKKPSIMKRNYLIMMLLCFCFSALAQNVVWEKPFVGYSSNTALTVERITMTPHKTLLEVSFGPNSGMSKKISEHSFLCADGKYYPVKKVSWKGVDKKKTRIKGKRAHFAMEFSPVPLETEVIHFAENPWDEGMKLCNIRKTADNTHTNMPAGWENVEYVKDDSLPTPVLCDDSTAIHVKILNYVPEAGKMLNIKYSSIDKGLNIYFSRFPINEKGEAEIRLHPCVPLTVMMGIGEAPMSPVVIVPGGDLSVLLDMGNAKDEFAAVAFKGTLAETNYKLNVCGMKNMIQYNYDTAYFDSLMNNPKPTCSNEIYRSFYNNRSKIDELESKPLRDMLYIMNARECLFYVNYMQLYMKDKVRKILGNKELNNNITIDLSPSCFAYHTESYGDMLFTSKYWTYCPLFADMTNYTGTDSKTRGAMFMAWDSMNRKFVLNQYNEDIFYLMNNIYCFINYGYSHNKRTFGSADLKDYYALAAQRWQNTLELFGSNPHIHINKYTDKKDEERKKSILKDYEGKRVVFVLYNGLDGCAAEKLNELDKLIAETDTSKIVFLKFDRRDLYVDIENWYQYAKNSPGEHYATTSSSYSYMFEIKHNLEDDKLYYEIYDSEGNMTLMTNDDEKARNVIR